VSIDVRGVSSGEDKTTWLIPTVENARISGVDFAVLAETSEPKREQDIDSRRGLGCAASRRRGIATSSRGELRQDAPRSSGSWRRHTTIAMWSGRRVLP
jgi:hypothetical protein